MADENSRPPDKFRQTIQKIWTIYRSGVSYKYNYYAIFAIYIMNIFILFYTLLSVLVRMIFAGNTLLELIPIILWVLPLFFIIPLITIGLYKNKNTIGSLLVMLIASLFLMAISPLLSKMTIINVINLFGVLLIFGGFHFKRVKHVSLKRPKISRKSIFWFVFLNIIGIGFPYSVSYMGHNPIVSIPVAQEMPQIGFIIDYSPDLGANVNWTSLSNITLNNISKYGYIILDAPADQFNTNSWFYNMTMFLGTHGINIVARPRETSTSDWHVSMQNINTYYKITQNLTKWIKDNNFESYIKGIEIDFSQAREENLEMMQYMRRVDIPGLCRYLRTLGNISSANTFQIYEQLGTYIKNQGYTARSLGMPMVLDDLVDGDNFIQLLMGHPMGIAGWNKKGITLERSTISYAMDGEVYSYYPYSYGLSLYRNFGNESIATIGIAGNISEDKLNIIHASYSNISEIVRDILILSGIGIQDIEIYSLNTIYASFGEQGVTDILTQISKAIEAQTGEASIPLTYTFRIHAFRMVFMAIDSYDWLI